MPTKQLEQDCQILQVTFKTVGDPQEDFALIISEAMAVWPRAWLAFMDRATAQVSGEPAISREIFVCRDDTVAQEGEMAAADVFKHLRAGDMFILGFNNENPCVIVSECSATQDVLQIFDRIKTKFNAAAEARNAATPLALN